MANERENILAATVRLIQERGSDPARVTVRDITAAAGVGTGLINYHFGSKENLIAACVQRIVGGVVERCREMYAGLSGLEEGEKLTVMVCRTADYLCENDNISRISILTDMRRRSGETDNTGETIRAYLPMVRAVRPDWGEEEALPRVKYLVYAVQGMFLRGELNDPAEREMRIRHLLNVLIGVRP